MIVMDNGEPFQIYILTNLPSPTAQLITEI